LAEQRSKLYALTLTFHDSVTTSILPDMRSTREESFGAI